MTSLVSVERLMKLNIHVILHCKPGYFSAAILVRSDGSLTTGLLCRRI
jgi:hypothetical protein